MRKPDIAFTDPRLAVHYDELDADRHDLDHYLALVEELGARRVLDVGCGTGCLAVLLAERDLDVIGVDPASASLDVARAKPYAESVTWVDGDATEIAELRPPVDLAVLTGNVAQVFVDDQDWADTLAAIASAVRPGGWLVLETRRPEARAWETWDVPPAPVTLADGSELVVSRTVTEVALPLVTFVSSTRIGGEVIESSSTLRFRERDEVERDLADHGFVTRQVRQAPDRPGLEYVFVAQHDQE